MWNGDKKHREKNTKNNKILAKNSLHVFLMGPGNTRNVVVVHTS